jgi:transcriptional regulatory protein RtcR
MEDLEPNIEHELQQFTIKAGHKVSFNKAAREQYLKFARSPQALWRANFRDLNSSITRMATLAVGGRITEEQVAEEISRLHYAWSGFGQQAPVDDGLASMLSAQALAELDLFDRFQLTQVLRICRDSRSLAEAGRILFNQSRTQKTSTNDSHRLKMYLQKFGLAFQTVTKSPPLQTD